MKQDAQPKAVAHETKHLRILLPWIRGEALRLCLAAAFAPLLIAMSLSQPYLIKRAIDAALQKQTQTQTLSHVALLYALTLLVDFAARVGQSYLLQSAGQNVVWSLRERLFQHLQNLRVAYFERTPLGSTTTRLTNDVEALSEVFASGAVLALADIALALGIVGFMLWIDWKLTLVAFAVFPPLMWIMRGLRARARLVFRAIRQHLSELNISLAEQLQGLAIIRSLGVVERCLADYRDANRAYRDANHRAIRYDALLYSIVESFALFSLAGVLLYAAARAQRAGLGSAAYLAYIGTTVAFYEYVQRFFAPIRDLSQKYTILQSSMAAAERVWDFLAQDEPDAAAAPASSFSLPTASTQTSALLSFEHVSFAYERGDRVLDDLSFRVREREMLALVGATGSGKSTVLSLMLRLYEIQEGRIALSERDIRSYPRHDLRGHFAYVPQDPVLLSGTILDNIVAASPERDRNRVESLLRRIDAWDWIASRPGGLEARVGERGLNFSVGERQLIAFVRALYQDRPILLLDEATSSMDSETEARVQRAMESLIRSRTCVVVAHRLSTIRHADRILLFQRGRILEQGSHDELLTQNGAYARLYAQQVEL